MATYLAHDALRLPAASLLAKRDVRKHRNQDMAILGVNVDTAYLILENTKNDL